MFRADYRGGVALLNRMLDHAARHRNRILQNLGHGRWNAEDDTGNKHLLSLTGEAREYLGDGNVWHWYRGTGVGPSPCTSALQALEFVTEEYIRAGVPPHVLTSIMLESAHSLAMSALALGVLVRHLEDAGEAIDPFLVEPTVWHLEFSRSISDQTSGLAARVPELPNPERRAWSLREVSMMLTLRAEGDRIDRLKALGDQLLAKATAEVGDDSSDAAREHLAAVRNWAASLDRAAYEIAREDDRLVIQQAVDPEVEQVLGDTNADLRRTNDAIGLTVRHAHVRRWRSLQSWAPQVDRWLETIIRTRMSIDHLVIAVRELEVADQIDQGLRWVERIVAGSGSDCASTFTLPEWLHEVRVDLLAEDQIARWQRVVDLLVVAGDSRVADLAD